MGNILDHNIDQDLDLSLKIGCFNAKCSGSIPTSATKSTDCYQHLDCLQRNVVSDDLGYTHLLFGTDHLLTFISGKETIFSKMMQKDVLYQALVPVTRKYFG